MERDCLLCLSSFFRLGPSPVFDFVGEKKKYTFVEAKLQVIDPLRVLQSIHLIDLDAEYRSDTLVFLIKVESKLESQPLPGTVFDSGGSDPAQNLTHCV